MVEDVDLVVVEGDDDLELRIVVEVADPDVLAVGAVAVVAGAVEVGIVARARQRSVLSRGHAVSDAPAGRYGLRAASTAMTCEPAGDVLVVVTTTSTLPSPSRSAAAIPRASGHWPPLHVDAGQPGLSWSCPPTRL